MNWERYEDSLAEQGAMYDDVRERYADSEVDGEYERECEEGASAAEVYGYCPSGDDIVVPQDRGMVYADEFEGEDIPF